MNRIIARLQTNEAANLFAQHDVVLAYLYGSQARGEAGALSDVDIAVLFASELDKKARFWQLLNLGNELGTLLQRDDVQVVDLAEATPLLRHRVYYDGHLLYCPDDAVRVKFETTALRDYVDTATLRSLQEKYVGQYFAEGDD